jgi:hypothetical protein
LGVVSEGLGRELAEVVKEMAEATRNRATKVILLSMFFPCGFVLGGCIERGAPGCRIGSGP